MFFPIRKTGFWIGIHCALDTIIKERLKDDFERRETFLKVVVPFWGGRDEPTRPAAAAAAPVVVDDDDVLSS